MEAILEWLVYREFGVGREDGTVRKRGCYPVNSA